MPTPLGNAGRGELVALGPSQLIATIAQFKLVAAIAHSAETSDSFDFVISWRSFREQGEGPAPPFAHA